MELRKVALSIACRGKRHPTSDVEPVNGRPDPGRFAPAAQASRFGVFLILTGTKEGRSKLSSNAAGRKENAVGIRA